MTVPAPPNCSIQCRYADIAIQIRRVQWVWLEQAIERGLIPDGSDQFNSLQALTAAWANMGVDGTLHLACCRTRKDEGTIEYMADCARQSGLETRLIYIEDIGINTDSRFTDLQENTIVTCSSCTRGNG